MSESNIKDCVGVGIISTAFIARKTIKAIRKAVGVRVVAVASRSLEKAKNFAEQEEIETCYGTYEELLRDPNVQAVYVPLPTAIRGEWVEKCARAGKHVLCEKPAATSLEELQKLIQCCTDNNVVWMDGVMFMHHKRTPAILDVVKKNGPVTFVHAAFSFAGDTNFFENNIRVKKSLEPFCALGDLGWYTIRAALMAFSWELPTQVSAISHRDVEHQGLLSDVTGTLMWADGRHSTFHSSFHHAFRQTLDIVGSWGRIVVNDFVLERSPTETEFTVISKSMPSQDHESVTESQDVVKITDCCQEQCMWERFARLIVQGDKDTSILETRAFWSDISLKTQVILDACAQSAAQNGAVIEIEFKL